MIDARALKRFSHREWAILRDLWIDHLPPIEFDTSYPEPTLWQLPPITCPELNASGTAEFPYVDGVREALFREAILLSRKFIYCGQSLSLLSQSGKNTLTAVAAYEACFYGAKALCYLLGFASLGRDSKLFLDAFFETERKVRGQKTKLYDTVRVHKVGERLTHELLWAVTARLIDTTIFNEELRAFQTDLKITDWESFSRFRNRIFYDGSFWPLRENMSMCDLISVVTNSEIIAAASLEDSESSPPFAREYFRTAALLRKLISGMFGTLAELAPALNREVDAFVFQVQASTNGR